MTAPLYLLLATLLPLGSFVILLFFGRRLGGLSVYLATGMILGSFLLSVWALVPWFSKMDIHDTHSVQTIVYPWITLWGSPAAEPAGTFWAGLLVDSLTLVLFVVISLISTLAHVFSISYMAGDPRLTRYFACLGLLCFSMLALVISNSLLQIFFFWQILTVASYLLISFWSEKRPAARAATKAGLLLIIGDAGFFIGLAILIWQLGPGSVTLFDEAGSPVLRQQVAQHAQVVLPSFGPERGTFMGEFAQEAARDELAFLKRDLAGPHFWGISWLAWAGICLFIAALSKSAQFPLHVWLPEAMEAPTPACALLAAATTAPAGIYLLARLFPILHLDVRLLIAMIGCVTVGIGALVTLVTTDLKKLLAYAAITQLGFMLLFLGSGGYVAGLFHLVTHAFFMSCLLLGAGTVLAGTGRTQNLLNLGGLWRKMPITAFTFGLAVLAIAGTPTFSGTISRDLGLAGVYEYAQALPLSDLKILGFTIQWAPALLFWIPAVATYLTALAMWRLWWLIFGGRPRDKEIHEQARESPVMTLPLIILGALAWVAGSDFFYTRELLELSEPLGALAQHPSRYLEGNFPGWGFHAVRSYILWACVAAPVMAFAIYYKGYTFAWRLRRLPAINVIYLWAKNKMFLDALYDGIIANVYQLLAALCKALDRYLLNSLANVFVHLTLGAWRSVAVPLGRLLTPPQKPPQVPSEEEA